MSLTTNAWNGDPKLGKPERTGKQVVDMVSNIAWLVIEKASKGDLYCADIIQEAKNLK